MLFHCDLRALSLSHMTLKSMVLPPFHTHSLGFVNCLKGVFFVVFSQMSSVCDSSNNCQHEGQEATEKQASMSWHMNTVWNDATETRLNLLKVRKYSMFYGHCSVAIIMYALWCCSSNQILISVMILASNNDENWDKMIIVPHPVSQTLSLCSFCFTFIFVHLSV